MTILRISILFGMKSKEASELEKSNCMAKFSESKKILFFSLIGYPRLRDLHTYNFIQKS